MDIQDVMSAYLSSKARVDAWEKEFMARFYKPITDLMINKAIENAKNSPNFDRGKIESRLTPQALRRFRGE